MKKIASLLLGLGLCCSQTLFALDADDLAKPLHLTQHWISYTSSFNLETDTKTIGTLYRRVLSAPLTYDFFDGSKRLLTTSRAQFFSVGAHFDVCDAQKYPVGSVEERIFTVFPSFVIYSPSNDPLANADMNFWGTKFSVVDPSTQRLIAVMSRPFFRLKNDWTIRVTDPTLLSNNGLKPELLLTVLAFQGDRESWEHQQSNPATALRLGSEQKLRQQVAQAAKGFDFSKVQAMANDQLEHLAVQLDEDYHHRVNQDSEGFVDYCLRRVQSEHVSLQERQGILYLLQQRLGASEHDHGLS